MKNNYLRFASISITLLILILLFLGLYKDQTYSTKYLVGKKLENFQIDSFNENSFLSEDDLNEGEYTLINFWASWCVSCKSEHSFLMMLNQNKRLKLLGINFKDKKSKALKFLEEFGDPYDLLAVDNSGKKSVSFGVYGIPESILINKKLVIIKKFVGPLNKYDYDEILEIIKQ
jgi:cytochrome c biogenesis protein CcmG/thiol:disulfide interchange protein DsbE|tara:strand:+ start:411 stop:932 length:522 start_codon:yes stop_codon:yes gene_type:complete